MRRHLAPLYLLISILVLFTSPSPFGQTRSRLATSERRPFSRVDLSKGQKYVPGEVLVRFKPGTAKRSMWSSHARVGAVVKREFQSVSGLQLAKLPSTTSLQRALHIYRSDPTVLYAEPNFVVHPLVLPNDPLFLQQWGLSNLGEEGGTPGADIHAPQAWDITTGSSKVVVAVIDSGIDYTHPDLAANVWSNPTTFSQTINGVGISCAAGTHGFNAVANSCDPMDDLGHGTHVSGIIGAVGNNGIGVSGVNWNVQLLPCKFIDSTGNGTTADAVTCLDYVKALKDQEVNVIATNNSWGGNFNSQSLIDAVTALQQDGILFIAAAGNDFSDNDMIPVYPANIFLPNVLSVAATTRMDAEATFSNVGAHTVHLGAPGQEILSTLPGGVYSFETGTSMATPFVTGVAALLAATQPTGDWRAIRNLLLAGGDTLPALANTISGKRLNAHGALTCSGSTVASRLQPTLLKTSGAVGSPVTLAYLNINCGQPNGPVSVQSSNGDTITLQDDGTGPDLAAGDGIYSGTWTPPATGTYSLSFPGGDDVNVEVLTNYYPWPVAASDYNYRTISGTNLNLGDDSVAAITSPFPIQFGGGSFSTLYVSSNGTISFTDVFGSFVDVGLPANSNYQPYSSLTTLVAPFWQDLYPVSGTKNNVFWEVSGAAPNRELVVEWRNVETYECRGDASATVTFQVVFDEGSSNVLFNYANTSFGGNCADQDQGAAAEVGIQVAPTEATNWSFEQPVLGNGTGILWNLVTGTPVSNPVPVIKSLSPSAVRAGGPDFLLTVTGSNFVPQSFVQANPSYRPTTFVSSTELQALIPAADIQYNGTLLVAVCNLPPGGGLSNYVNLTITGEAAPVITALSPSSAVAGGFSFQLEVDGSGFVPGSLVQWNGTTPQSFYDGPNKLIAVITGDLIASPGSAQITVNNYADGGTSNAVSFPITTPSAPSAALSNQTLNLQLAKGKPGLGSVPGTIKSPKFLPRFWGWKMARKEGAEYVQHFSRPRAGTALRSALAKPGNAVGGFRTNPFAQTLSANALPGFQFRPSIPTDLLPTSVATGDFNHDGHMDWVVANGGANTLWIYFGNGDGTAQPPVIIPLKGQSPVSVTAADLRGRGNLDLIVAEADSGQVGVLLGNGDGTFGTETPYYVPGAPICLLIDDFNGDGHKDILVGMAGDVNTGELALLPGDGAGHFGPPIFRPYEFPFNGSVLMAANVAEADLNGDGFPDLVVNDINSVTPAVYAYLNQKDGTFKISQAVDFPFCPGFGPCRNITNVALGKLNASGCTDLVDTDTFGNAIVFPGNCDGTFQTNGIQQLGVGDVISGLALMDVNGDGNLDIVTSSVVFLDTLLYGEQPGNVVSVLLGDGQGNFSDARVFRGQPSMYTFAFADLNGDGKLDLVTANQDADSVSIFLNDGTGGFGMPAGGYIGYLTSGSAGGVINAPYTGFKVADVNGDGKPDLVLLEQGRLYPDPFNLTVLLNNGSGQFSNPIRSPVIDSSYKTYGRVGDFALADFRNTGRPDFIAIGQPQQFSVSSSYIAYAKNNGDGTFTPLPLATPAGAQGLIGVGDFNGDGKLDFVTVGNVFTASGTWTSTLNVFLGNGDGTFTPGYSTTFNPSAAGNYPVQVFVGDFNGDGKPDVLVHLGGTGAGTQGYDVYEFLGKGDGTFAPAKDVLQNFGAMNVADLNHDGISDVVEIVEPLTTLADHIPLQYAVYLGQPDGSFALKGTYQPYAGELVFLFTEVPGVMLADFNGDGNTDIAAFQVVPSANVPGRTYVQILLGNGDGTFTPTYTTFAFNGYLAPQFAADLNGDGKADLLQLAGYDSSYHVVPAETGPALQVALVSYPIIGLTGSAQVTLALPSASDTAVHLASSDPAIRLPATVTIPANSVSQEFQFQIGSGFNPHHVFTIQATLGMQTATAFGWLASGSQPLGFTMDLLNPYMPAILPSQATGNYGLQIVSLDGYSGTVQLSCTGLPSWARCQFGAASLPLSPGGLAQSSLAVTTTSAAVVGTYPFAVVGTDGTFTAQVSATVSVGDFGVSISPSTATAQSTGSASYSLSISSVNGYSGTVQTSISGLPTGATLASGLGPVAAGASNLAFSIQTTNVGPGSYVFTVTGTAGSLTRSATATLQVQGAAPVASVSPPSLSFGNELLGTPSVAQPVKLSNTGTARLTITRIRTSGDFSQTNNCAWGVAAGGSCTIKVTFTPTAEGVRKGTITILDNAKGSPQVVPLMGAGTVVKLSPVALSFGRRPVGTTSRPQIVTLTNIANTRLKISGMSITPVREVEAASPSADIGRGPPPADFAETNNCGTSVAPGASCAISVTFTPRTIGLAIAYLTVSDDGGGSPQHVPLFGVCM